MVRSVSYMIAVEESTGASFLSPGPPSPPTRKKSVTLRVEDIAIGGHLLVPPGGGGPTASSETLTEKSVAAAAAKKRHPSLTSEPSEEESEEEEPVKKHLQEPPSTGSCMKCKLITFLL